MISNSILYIITRNETIKDTQKILSMFRHRFNQKKTLSCIYTGRKRSVFSKLGVSRIQLRKLANNCLFTGIKKSSF
jgi:ribosomal protein S14